jgi:hypothetical protein
VCFFISKTHVPTKVGRSAASLITGRRAVNEQGMLYGRRLRRCSGRSQQVTRESRGTSTVCRGSSTLKTEIYNNPSVPAKVLKADRVGKMGDSSPGANGRTNCWNIKSRAPRVFNICLHRSEATHATLPLLYSASSSALSYKYLFLYSPHSSTSIRMSTTLSHIKADFFH